jgi:hypothetical protein
MELLNLSTEDLDWKDSAVEAFYRISTRQANRKDFIEMYFLLQHFSLEEVLVFFGKKHPKQSLFRALMSLTYFVDAENFEMPKMFVDFDWEQGKSFILNKVKEYENRY